MDYPRFNTAQVAHAAGVPAETLRTWIKRGDIHLVPPDEFAAEAAPAQQNPGTGRSRMFTARRALHIALVAELARAGMPIKEASYLALEFSDTGETVAGWGNEIPESRRAPGGLFPRALGLTVFRVLFSGSSEPVPTTDLLEEIGSIFDDHGRTFTSALAIDLNDLSGRVNAALGQPARAGG